MEFHQNEPHPVELFRASMRGAASSVSLVTSRFEGENFGMAVTSWASVSVSPPAMLVVINRSASVHAAISASGRYCVNIMAGSQAAMLRQFSRTDLRHLRFNSEDWEQEQDGPPVLKGAVSSLSCTVETASDYSTHTIFVGRVDRVILSEPEARNAAPLIWMDGSPVSLAMESDKDTKQRTRERTANKQGRLS